MDRIGALKGALWDFLTSILSQNIKQIEWVDPLEKQKKISKSLTMPEKQKGGPFSLARNCMFS